jgi:ribosomal protein S3AE
MEFDMPETDVLPSDKRTRKSYTYAVVHTADNGMTLVTECGSKREAMEFINSLIDPNAVQKIYRATDVIVPRQRVVVEF